MKDSLIDVQNYYGEGYKSLVSFGAWRVAVLRYMDKLEPANIDSMERHTETDEVFILINGKAMLILGGNDDSVSELYTITLVPGEINNIKQGTWHTIIVDRDVHLIIVENDNTNDDNSEYCSLSITYQNRIQKLASEFLSR